MTPPPSTPRSHGPSAGRPASPSVPASPSATSRSPFIVVVGDVMVDVVVRPTAPFAPSSDTPSVIALGPGGSAANQAVAMAAAGAEVHLVGAAGRDAFGSQALDCLRAAGVHPHLALVSGRTTGVVVALVDGAGDRSMLTDRGANLALVPEMLPDELFRPGGHLHLSGYELLDAPTRPAGIAALASAANAGMTRSVDPSSAGPLAAYGAAAFLDATEGLDWCCANLDEGRVLAGAGSPEAILAALARHYREVVLTAGADGVFLHSEGQALHGAARPTGRVVDTTGAGDAFTGTFLARRLAGDDPDACLHAGIVAAAKVIGTAGGRIQPQVADP